MFNKPKPEQSFTDSIALAKSMRALIESTMCPACKQNMLKLSQYTIGKEWGATFICDNCFFNGEVNSTGFDFRKIDSKGRAVR